MNFGNCLAESDALLKTKAVSRNRKNSAGDHNSTLCCAETESVVRAPLTENSCILLKQKKPLRTLVCPYMGSRGSVKNFPDWT